MKNKRPTDLPETFDTLEEMADFWDTHDLAGYADYLTPVEMTMSLHPTHEKEQGDSEQELLPSDWRVAVLSRVTMKTKNRDPRSDPEQHFRYIDVSSVSNELFQITGYAEILGADAPSRARKVVRAGDTIFATVRPYLRNIARVPPELDNAICSTGYCVIRPDPNHVHSDFLYFLALSDGFVSRVVDLQRGSSYPAVSDKDVLAQPIPLPPLPEQRRIAAVLNAIQDASAAQEDVIAAARAFKRSLMQRLFTYGPGREPAPTKETEIGEIPAHWEVTPIAQVIQASQYGINNRAELAGTYPVLRMNNLADGKLDISDLKYVELDELTLQRYRLNSGDILFNRTNSFELVGKTALFELPGTFTFASYLVRLVTNHALALPSYVTAVLNHEVTQTRLKYLATRGVSQSNISPTKLKTLEIPLTSLAEQQEVVSALNAADDKISAEEDRKTALEALFKSMLHQLMTGQIRLLADEGLPVLPV